jgi:hypothetical protein
MGRDLKAWARDGDVVEVGLEEGEACVHNVKEVESEKQTAKIVIQFCLL